MGITEIESDLMDTRRKLKHTALNHLPEVHNGDESAEHKCQWASKTSGAAGGLGRACAWGLGTRGGAAGSRCRGRCGGGGSQGGHAHGGVAAHGDAGAGAGRSTNTSSDDTSADDGGGGGIVAWHGRGGAVLG